MHGRVKVRTTEEQEKIKQAEKQKKTAEFKKGIELVFRKRKNQEWDSEIFLVTEKLLVKHPDVYTLWNIRRETFIKYKWSEEELTDKLEKELILTEISLRENPKSYSVWYQRIWVNERLPNPNWKRELELCEKCLMLDERNFHCWDYRRFLVSKANIPDLEELKFTTSKILNNFSNYSSWHYRSKLLQKLYPSSFHDLPIRQDKHDEELDLVMNATFTDPNDTSAWFYQRWLLNYWKPELELWHAVLTKTKIIAVFHKETSIAIQVLLNNEEIKCDWKSADGRTYSTVWSTFFNKPLERDFESVVFKTKDGLYKLEPIGSEWIYESKKLNGNHNCFKLQKQLENYQMLLKMEPFNKWAKLTSMYLMLNINPVEMHSDIVKELNDLIQVDPMRENYYQDMKNKCIIKYSLDIIGTKGNKMDFSNKNLTTLSNQEPYLAFYEDINLSNNCLGNHLHQLYALQECSTLDLSKNSITSLKTFPTLYSLKILILNNNQISDFEEVLEVIRRHNLTELHLKGNPVLEKECLIKNINHIFKNLQVAV